MTTPTGILFADPRVKPLSVSGQFQAGCYYQFYLTGTTTLANVYSDGALTTPLSQVPFTGGTTAAGDGRFVPIYLNPATIYRVQLYNSNQQLLEDTDPYVVPASSATTTSFATVTAGTSNLFRSQNGFAFTTLVDGGTITIDATKGNDFIATIAGNRTFANPTGLIDGQPIVLWVVQDGAGGRTATFGSVWQFNNVTGTPTVDPTPNGVTVIKGEYNVTLNKIIVELFTSVGGAVPFSFTLGSQQNFNLLAALGGNNTGAAISVTITVPAGVIVSSSSTLIPAMDLTGLFTGSTIALTNNGYILGAGGDAGNGAGLDCLGAGTEFGGNGPGMAQAGAAAGPAILGPGASVTLNLSNANGFIWGGGGGGGGGGVSLNAAFNSSEVVVNAGGGGGGAGGGKGGRGGTATGMQFLGSTTTASQRGGDGVPGGTGPNGVLGAAGAAGAVLTAGSATGSGQSGGGGGDWGAAGTAGVADATYHIRAPAGAAGAAGNAITKSTGTVNFITGTNTAPHVKGAVV